MLNLKTVLFLFAIIASCHCQHQIKYVKKHHHGLHHIKFLHYLIFLAIKLKLVVFFGTIFTIGLVAAKIFGIIKLTEYMKHKYHNHEEKIVYEDPHEHHQHYEYSGFPGDSGGFAADFPYSKSYSPSYPGSDVSLDHPPSDTGQYPTAIGSSSYEHPDISSRNLGGGYDIYDIYHEFMQIPKKLKRLNITEKAFMEMGIKHDNCKKRFVCQADFNAKQNPFLQTGFDMLGDESYQKYRSNMTITSEEDCDSLYKDCED